MRRRAGAFEKPGVADVGPAKREGVLGDAVGDADRNANRLGDLDNTVVRCTAGVERGETSVGFGRREKEGPHDLDVAECSRGGRPRLNACGERKRSKAPSGGGGRDKSDIGRKGGSRRLQGNPRADPFHVLKADATDAESE